MPKGILLPKGYAAEPVLSSFIFNPSFVTKLRALSQGLFMLSK